MTIGNNNVFEVDCKIEAMRIGDNNIVESKGCISDCVVASSDYLFFKI